MKIQAQTLLLLTALLVISGATEEKEQHGHVRGGGRGLSKEKQKKHNSHIVDYPNTNSNNNFITSQGTNANANINTLNERTAGLSDSTTQVYFKAQEMDRGKRTKSIEKLRYDPSSSNGVFSSSTTTTSSLQQQGFQPPPGVFPRLSNNGAASSNQGTSLTVVGPASSSNANNVLNAQPLPLPDHNPNNKKPTTRTSSSSTTTNSLGQKTANVPSHSELTSGHDDNVHRKRTSDGGKTRERRRAVMTADIKPHKVCSSPGVQYIVTCRNDKEQECRTELEDHGVDIIHMINGTKFFAVCVDSDEDYDAMRHFTDVDDVEEDRERHLIQPVPPASSVVNMHNSDPHRYLTQTTPYGIELVNAIEFHSQYDNQGEGVRVCVIDSGLDADHEDLGGNDVGGSNDGDLQSPWFEDGLGHGTHVAGTIAAADNDDGVIGVAPNVDLFIARVFGNDGSFTASSLIDAFNECVSGGSDIISMSLGGPFFSSAESAAIDALVDQGILVIAAAGNDGDDSNPLLYPAAYDSVMSVAALDEDENIALFSTYNDAVDISAPGVEVESLRSGGGTTFLSGTSMACPHVSGVAALLMSQFPNEPISRIREAMENSATGLGPCGKNSLYGSGLVDTMAAAEYLENAGSSDDSIQEGCGAGGVETTVNTVADGFGSETFWFVLFKPGRFEDFTGIVFRGGPFDDDETDSNTFNLPRLEEGCYEFRLIDTFGDGTCCSSGRGEHEVIYDGEQVLFEDDFETDVLSVTFGCAEDNGPEPTPSPTPDEPEPTPSPTPDEPEPTPSPTPDGPEPTPSPTPEQTPDGAICGNGVWEPGEQCDDGNSDSGDGCSPECEIESCDDGEMLVDWRYNTDGFGSETTWQLVSSNGDTIYASGTHLSDSYYEHIMCVPPDACYNLTLIDSFGDGFCCGGTPFYTLTVDGNVLADENVATPGIDFGSSVSFEFGDGCGTSGAVCGNGVLEPGEECDDGNVESGDGCSSTCQIEDDTGPSSCTGGLVSARISLETDSDSLWQNELYFFDVTADNDEFVFAHPLGGLGNNLEYSGETCLDPQACYQLYFFDSFGNGLSTGGLTFSYDDQTALQIDAGDMGEQWVRWSATTYWMAEVGDCASSS